jgi:membrane associated rhomboid family serine protease
MVNTINAEIRPAFGRHRIAGVRDIVETYRSLFRGTQMNGSVSLSRSWVFRLIIINVVIFLAQVLTEGIQVVQAIMVAGQQMPISMPFSIHYFGLTPVNVIQKLFLWQVVTYMFLHGGLLHLFLNMYALFLFGIPIEQAWGSRRFLFYYFFTGVGGGVMILLLNMSLGGAQYYTPTIGASGAVFGILLAFGMLFPDVELIMLFIPFPIKAKYMVMIYGGIEVVSLVFSRGESNISHIGHVGGLIFGLVYFFIVKKHGIRFRTKMIRAKMTRHHDRRAAVQEEEGSRNRKRLDSILQKVRHGGADSLSDDEYQDLKFLEIMHGGDENICVEEDFSGDDQYCQKCVSYEACMIREIKKYL